MGSFNTTCAISHAPIRPNDKVRLFFLASQIGYSVDSRKSILSIGCQCYPWDDFQVIGGISLEATYEDYNSYSFDENSIFAQLILNQIKKNYSENVSIEGKEYNPYHDHMDVNVNDLDWEKILDMIHSGRLYLKEFGHRANPAVGMMAIHESVYEIMMKETYEEYKVDNNDYKNAYYVTVGFEDRFKEDIEKYNAETDENAWKEFYQYFEEEVEKGEITEEDAIKQAKLMLKHQNEFESDPNCKFTFQSLSVIRELRAFSEKIAKLKDTENALEVNEHSDIDLIKKHTESIYFNERMMTHNFMYRPLMTSGQEYDLTDHGVFLKKVSDAILTINSSAEEDEYLATKKFSKQWQEISLSEILERLEEWYDEEELKKQVDLLKPIFENLSLGEKLIIDSSEIKDEKYKPLIGMVWNKALDLYINIDTKF